MLSLIKLFILLFVLLLAPVNKAKADIKDTILDILTGLTCETQGVGDLLRSEFSHTCIPASFFTFLVANIVSPGIYANTLLHLKINDDEMFPGACKRVNRINPNDPTISFAFCSNVKLIAVRSKAIALSVVAIAKAMLTGEDPWNDIKNAWTISKDEYHEIKTDRREGDSEIMWDVGILPIIPWKVIKDKDKLCVATPTFYADWIPVGCKYIKEPYPKSIYAKFMSLGDHPDEESDPQDVLAITECSSAGGCYRRAYENSKTGLVITAPLIECIREMLVRLLVSRDVCTFDDIDLVVNTAQRESSSFFQFQRNMHKAVTAFITIYVILFGIKILLSEEPPPSSEIYNFILKIIFVTYFSVGININPLSNSDYGRLDGMIQLVFPLLLGGIHQLASWIMNASPSELCKFDSSEYLQGLQHIALWDALDCRISHYLGLDVIKTLFVENQAREHDAANFDFFNFSIPPYYYLLIPAILTGNMMLFSLVLMYPLLVISVGAYMINATVVCMIGIVIIGILAPIFVPMMLFEYTKGFFEGWVKLLISFLLQPMVVVTFMITMFSVYDFGFYGKCKYTFSTVKSGDRDTKIFYIDNDWSKYSLEEFKDCRNSIGFMLNNPVAALYDFSKETVQETAKTFEQTTAQHMSQYDFLDAVASAPALFFTSPRLLFEKIKNLVLALITACFTLYLLYHFSAQMSEFAADMTEGASIGSAAIKPQAIFKAGMKVMGGMRSALKAANKASKNRPGGAGSGGGAGGGGGASSGAGESSDKISSGGGAQDKITIGGHRKAPEAKDNISTSGPAGDKNVTTIAQVKRSGDSKAPSNIPENKESKKVEPSIGRDNSQKSLPITSTANTDAKGIENNLSKFMQEKNIKSNELKDAPLDKLSASIAATGSPNAAKGPSSYENLLASAMKNGELKNNAPEYRKRVEGMTSGKQKDEIVKIHDRVLGGPSNDVESRAKGLNSTSEKNNNVSSENKKDTNNAQQWTRAKPSALNKEGSNTNKPGDQTTKEEKTTIRPSTSDRQNNTPNSPKGDKK